MAQSVLDGTIPVDLHPVAVLGCHGVFSCVYIAAPKGHGWQAAWYHLGGGASSGGNLELRNGASSVLQLFQPVYFMDNFCQRG